MQSIRQGLWILYLAVFLCVAGCASGVAKRTATGLEIDLNAGPNEGYAVLRVVSLVPISSMNPKWQRITLTSNGRSEELPDVTSASNAFFQGKYFATESLHFAKLPVGKYEISGFNSIGPGPGLIPALLGSSNAKTSVPSLFMVETGKLANLGTLVFSPEIEKEKPAQVFLMNGPLGRRYALDTLLAESKLSETAFKLGGGWASEESVDEERRVLSLVRSQVSQLYFRASQGNLMGSGHLGQVVRRTGKAQWISEPVDTLSTVFAISRTRDGQQVAGGEYGTFFVQSSDGQWSGRRIPNEMGRVVYVEPRGPKGALLATTESNTSKYWIVESVSDPKEVPQEVARLEALPDLVLSTADELIVPGRIPGILRVSDIRRINKSDFRVTKDQVNFWILEWQLLPEGQIRMTRQNGASPYASKSVDTGKSWTHEETQGGISSYWMDQNSAYSLMMNPGFSTVTNTLTKTLNGGSDWKQTGVPLVTERFAGQIVYADSTEVLVKSFDALYSTVDEGKTWVRVLPPKQ